MLCPTYYYQLINRQRQSALVFKKSKDPTKQGAFLEEPNQQELEQLWIVMEKNIDRKTYYLLHCLNDLKLTTHKEDIVSLQNKDKHGQVYVLEPNDQAPPLHFWIKEEDRPSHLLALTQNGLRMVEEDPAVVSTQWELRRVTKNQQINHTCIISCAHSGLVLSPHHSHKEGKQLRQCLWKGLFSQRWLITPEREFFRILNFDSKREATISQKALDRRVGTEVNESVTNKNGHNQWWSLQEVGRQMYCIRSAFAQNLYMGVKGVKQDAEVELVSGEIATVWHIVGIW